MNKVSIAFFVATALIAQPLAWARDDAHGPEKTAAAADPSARQFGEEMPADQAAQSLSDAIAKHEDGGSDQVISGRVGQVCQKQGCWMTLSDGDNLARVMTGHEFLLPKDLKGDVVVYGKLEAFNLDQKEIQHMAKESGKPETEISAREYRIAARGVALR